MRRQRLPLYAIALAIVVVGALAVGVPAKSLAFGLLALACPLMMLFMHGGHGGHGGHEGHHHHQGHDPGDKGRPSSPGRLRSEVRSGPRRVSDSFTQIAEGAPRVPCREGELSCTATAGSGPWAG
ncbi:DUF2933 domain-containing protein [Micromonospora purpureochromogenes]|uniref:DUF2933 domain-containing protein n=1 Tax=Micromonospora purpureochromogenes TaxID=47872 RepID=UPI000B5B0C3A